jgi:hypothetical protein
MKREREWRNSCVLPFESRDVGLRRKTINNFAFVHSLAVLIQFAAVVFIRLQHNVTMT